MSLPSISTQQATFDRLEYQPLSLLAVLGLGLSALFASVLAIAVLVAMFQGTHLFFGGWFLVLPLAGVLLSALAYWRIRGAEGALAGQKIALWGIGVGVLFSLLYVTYEVAIALALRQQANYFLTVKDKDSGFFPLLLEGDVNGAFLLTQPATARSGANPRDPVGMTMQFDAPMGDNPKGMLSAFAENELVHLLAQAAKENKEPVASGTQSWIWEKKSFRVERLFKLETDTVKADITTTIRSAESDAPREGRKWFVSLKETGPISLEFTPKGRNLWELRGSAHQFLSVWAGQTDKPEQRKSFPRIETDLATLTIPEGVGREAVTQEIRDYFSSKGPLNRGLQLSETRFGPWEMRDDKLEIEHFFVLPLQLDAQTNAPRLVAFGRAVARSQGPVKLGQVEQPVTWEFAKVTIRQFVGSARPGAKR